MLPHTSSFFFSSISFVVESHTTLFPLSSSVLQDGKDSVEVDVPTPSKKGDERGIEFKVLQDLWRGNLLIGF
jgi:hypothetical protein